ATDEPSTWGWPTGRGAVVGGPAVGFVGPGRVGAITPGRVVVAPGSGTSTPWGVRIVSGDAGPAAWMLLALPLPPPPSKTSPGTAAPRATTTAAARPISRR